jgi:beta-lactamase class A
MICRALSGVLLTTMLAVPAGAQTAPPMVAGLSRDLTRLIAASGAEVAVAWQPLDAKRNETLLIHGDLRFHAASTMKVPIMIELFRQAETRRLKLDDTIAVTNHFTSIVDGSPYELSATEDSDGDVYKAIGSTMSYRALCEAMITKSSNLAANVLITALWPKRIQATVGRLGASGMQVLRGVEDLKAFDKGLNNTTDARGLMTLMLRIGRGEAVNRQASDDMTAILKRQQFNDAIPAGLPASVVVAHKTGNVTGIHHDAAIVYAKRPYVLVVLVRGINDEKVSAKLIADISQLVWTAQGGA